MEWQPIETAPRDGTVILAACQFTDGQWDYWRPIRWDKEWEEWIFDGIRHHLYNTGDDDDDRFPRAWVSMPEPPYLADPAIASLEPLQLLMTCTETVLPMKIVEVDVAVDEKSIVITKRDASASKDTSQ